jgi:hypothetical protein
MLNRRKFIAATTVAAGFALVWRTYPALLQYRTDRLEAQRLHTTVNETMGKHFTQSQITEFTAFFRSNFGDFFDASIPQEVFDKKVCTEFIVNSNLAYVGFDLSAYQFIHSGVCNPFFLASLQSAE